MSASLSGDLGDLNLKREQYFFQIRKLARSKLCKWIILGFLIPFQNKQNQAQLHIVALQKQLIKALEDWCLLSCFNVQFIV